MQNIRDVKRANLRLIIEKYGVAEVCARTGMKAPQLSQYVGRSQTRNLGDRNARRIEQAFNLPPNYMDTLHEASLLDQLLNAARHAEPDVLVSILRQLSALTAKIDELSKQQQRAEKGHHDETPSPSQQDSSVTVRE